MFLLSLAAPTLPADAVADALPAEQIRALQTSLDQALGSTVGAAAAISTPAGRWLGASGIANLRTGFAVMPDDLFQIGSITKPFVSTVVLQLWQEGRLTLEDSLTRWLPSEVIASLPNAEQITLRQLLNHTSGIPDYVPILLESGVNLFREWQPQELIELIGNQSTDFAPGTDWSYSNTNYILLGLIIEQVTGNSVAAEIRERILDPLGLENTFFAGAEAIPPTVSGYWDVNNDGNLDDVSNLSLSWAGAAGALVSNTQDLIRFAEALFGGELLQPDTLAQMLDFRDDIPSNAFSGYGLGIARFKTTEGTFYGHTGLTLGFRSSLWYSPETQVIYTDLQNTRRFNNLFSPLLATWEGQPNRSLVGTAGNDFLLGSGKLDTIQGQSGDDVISGGKGNDFLWGNAGRDRFYLVPGEGIDGIADFVPTEDRILLPNLDFEQITLTERYGNTIISLTATGERLAGLINVTVSELTAANFVSTLT
ncbi:MAG: serine hydrolase [Synechococcales cyanobacterium M58_A2018_015]|nr:serine hydrolase [Synechococcales cyanobacterium M58_A2018_015]